MESRANLENALLQGDAEAVQNSIFELGQFRNADGMIPDGTAFYLIDILRRPALKTSTLAGHILGFWEFEARHLSPRAKDRCVGFLREWGNAFTDTHAVQLVAELRSGGYLK